MKKFKKYFVFMLAIAVLLSSSVFASAAGGENDKKIVIEGFKLVSYRLIICEYINTDNTEEAGLTLYAKKLVVG